MKKLFLIAILIATISGVNAQKVKVITVVESIVPGGIGRSRIIEHNDVVSADEFTTARTDGKHSNQSKVKRKNLKAQKLNETKLLNFYSVAGINFQNVASNDAIISSKINEMLASGWKLSFVTSGVESKGSEDDMFGIFITRMFFQKDNNSVEQNN